MTNDTRTLIDNNSTLSSMRWAFITMVKLSVAYAVVIGVVVIMNPFLPNKIDAGSLIALEGVLLGSAFTGKAVQSFSEKTDTPNPPVSTPPKME